MRCFAIAACILGLAAVSHAAIVPAAVVDATTQGSWIGTYGSDGYILAGYDNTASDRVDLPDYIASYSTPPAQRWNWGVSDARAMQDPLNPAVRKLACWYADPTFTLNLVPARDVSFQLGVYVVSEAPVSRVETLSISGGGLAGTDTFSNFGGGMWYVYDVTAQAGVPVALTIVRSVGVNAVVSGLAFDVPEPASIGLLAVGGVLALIRRRR